MVFAILACLSASPSECRWISPPQDEMSLAQCVSFSQIALARWSAQHPEWIVRQTRCSG